MKCYSEFRTANGIPLKPTIFLAGAAVDYGDRAANAINFRREIIKVR